MGKVVYDISRSLDGFIAGANARPEAGWAGLGDGGERLHDWGFNSTDPRNLKVVESWASKGASIFGRTTYNNSILNWGADGPTGAARLPTIIVSHTVPQDIPDGGVYTFVDSIEAALETAKKAAGDKDIGIAGGNIAQQFLALGLVDEIFIHLVPVLFAAGARLIEDLRGKHVQLETIEVIETKEAIHLRFRVIKQETGNLMKQTQLTHWEAIKIGLLLSAGVSFLSLIIRPDSWSFTIFSVNAMIVVILFGIIGALLGSFLSRTRKGAWLGAGVTLFLLFWWLYTIASNTPLD